MTKQPIATGSMRNQCGACGRLFGGLKAFDAHRTGEFMNPANPRRCRSDAEMAEAGLTMRSNGYYGRESPTYLTETMT